MRRREFIGLIGSVAATWALAARAQPPAMPVVGFIRSTSAAASMSLVAAFRKGLAEAGLVEGKDVAIELSFADDDFDRLPALASDLVRRGAAVIVGNNFAVPAIRAATTTIPVVFVGGDDPVRTGLVASLNKPGGNVTGITSLSYALTTKRLQLLHELVPKSAAIAVLIDPHAAEFAPEEREAKDAARALGREILVVQAGTAPDLEAAFATIARARPGALLVGGGAFLASSQRQQLVAFAARQGLITIYQLREAVVAGGLMSYGTSQPDAYRQAGVYVARILKGEKPADLPVMQPTKFEFVINLKTAKTLSLAFPSGVLAIADEVIE
ncbi:MAG TPA: ABC transporter substrate-binding protein [Mesorhizobium sp.]|nr:ABC transporter substrate-binding protein [Mesorhizobium sp.]